MSNLSYIFLFLQKKKCSSAVMNKKKNRREPKMMKGRDNFGRNAENVRKQKYFFTVRETRTFHFDKQIFFHLFFKLCHPFVRQFVTMPNPNFFC